MDEQNIVEEIKGRLNSLTTDTLDGEEISQQKLELSVLIGRLTVEIVKREQAYLEVQRKLFDENSEITLREAELKSKTTNEYKEYREAMGLEKALIETIRALKYRLNILKDEYEASRNL